MTTTQTDEIKTWQQRLEETCPAIGPMHIHACVEEVNDAMQAEIDDLRAALQEQAREGEAVAPSIKQITEAICAGQKQRSGESNKGTSQIPWTHTVGACAEVGNGANEHLQYRVGQTNAERSDHQCNSGCSGVSSGGAVCGQVAPQPEQPESIECDCGRIHKKTRYGWACSEPAQPDHIADTNKMVPADHVEQHLDMVEQPEQGERPASKAELLKNLTQWLDGLGLEIHTYSLRGIAMHGFEKGWDAAMQSAQPVAQPLTDEQIDAFWNQQLTVPQIVQRRVIARAIEAAHGIGGAL